MSIRLNSLEIQFRASYFTRLGPERRNLVIGLATGLLVVLCWAAWAVATRFAVTSHLRPADVAFLRYGIATVLLAPALWRHGFGPRQIGVKRTLLLVVGAGLPFVLMSPPTPVP